MISLHLYNHALRVPKRYHRLFLVLEEIVESFLHPRSAQAGVIMGNDYTAGDHSRVEEIQSLVSGFINVQVQMHETILLSLGFFSNR